MKKPIHTKKAHSPAKKRVLNVPKILVAMYCIVFFVNHAASAWFHVATITPKKYQTWGAVDLKVTPELRYGYLSDQHGAFLVKTHNGSAFTFNQPHNDYGKEAFNWMKTNLELYPLRAVLEAVLYAAVCAYAFVLVPWLSRKMRGVCWPGRIILGGLFWAGGWVLLTTPLMLFDYGGSLYTTWNGPGALCWSGSYFGTVTGLSAETISYRAALEGFGAPATIALIGLVPDGINLSIREFVVFCGILFYGMLGCLVAAGGSAMRAFIPQE